MAEFVNLLQSEAASKLELSFRKSPLPLGLVSAGIAGLPRILTDAKRWLHIRTNGNVGLSEMDQKLFAQFYGEQTAVLGNKAEFPHFMRKIGFPSPLSALVQPEQDLTKTMEYIQSSLGSKTSYFLKPLDGVFQIGAHEVHQEQLQNEIKHIQEPTLVQENVPHKRWIRCIRYKDTQGYVYFAAFEYDKESTAGKFTSKATKITFTSLKRFMKNKASPANDAETSNLFHYIEDLLLVMQKELHTQIPYFSCDIGLVDEDLVNSKKYNLEQMKLATSFFETQNFPSPWEITSQNTSHPIKTYINLWKLFIKEHGKEMLARLHSEKSS